MAVSLISKSTRLSGSNEYTNLTPYGYCHELQLTADINGNITPNSIVLGNKGDQNIASIEINLDALKKFPSYNIFANYSLLLTVYDPSQERSENNPKIYIFDDCYIMAIPNELTTQATKVPYRCLFKLVEKDPSTGSVGKQENWVSKEFIASVNDTVWEDSLEPLLERAEPYEDQDSQYEYLAKDPITLTQTEGHYGMKPDKTSFGDKQDAFVSRVEFRQFHDDEGLVKKYGLFQNEDWIIPVLFTETSSELIPKYRCLVPREITNTAKPVTFTLIATSEKVEDNEEVDNDGFKRWVSTPLTFTIQDNFLDDIPIEAYTDFFLLDNAILETREGFLFVTNDYVEPIL